MSVDLLEPPRRFGQENVSMIWLYLDFLGAVRFLLYLLLDLLFQGSWVPFHSGHQLVQSGGVLTLTHRY